MNRNTKRSILFLLFLSLLTSTEGESFSSSSRSHFEIRSHCLRVEIDPARHFLRAEDRIELRRKEREGRIVSFLINSNLKIIEVVDRSTGTPLSWKEIPSSNRVKRLDVDIGKKSRAPSLSISYEGFIYDPVVKEKTLQFVRGDQTSGLIGSEGVYLSSSTHWFPDQPGSMALFHLEASVPLPFRVVTQGELVSEELKGSLWISKWRNEWPSDGFVLVAGRYSVRSRKVNGVKISTYFFPEDERFSEAFLDGAEEYLTIYTRLLGPFPYRKFDIVQNFFASGYSFPTFTLLAPEAIRQGKEFLRPGALDHEIVHSWWGHHVGVKPGTGNWSEALTTYCTNYFYKELKRGEEAARKHRQEVLQKYAIQVPVVKDYPLRQFEGKEGETDAQIGYGKGSMVFHMLRQMVGREAFFATLSSFAERYGGKQATWDDLRIAFEEAHGKRLDWFFSQWLDRSGGPMLKLGKVECRVSEKGYHLSGEVVQEGEVYKLSLPVEIDLGEEKRVFTFDVSKGRTSIDLEVTKLPFSLTLDPETHLFRRLHQEEIIPCLNAFLEDPEKIYVLSNPGDDERGEAYSELARMAWEKKGGEILSEREVTEEKISGSSLMVLGEGWKSPALGKLFSKMPGPVALKDGILAVGGKRVDGERESLLLTYPHPLRPGKWITVYFGPSIKGLSRARYVFFYGWESYILFNEGRPAERGNFWPHQSRTSHDFLSRDSTIGIEPKRLKDHVSFLASPERAGRFPETHGYHQTQSYLIKRLEENGVSPIAQPFTLTVKDIEKSEVILRKSTKQLKAIPFLFAKEGEFAGPFVYLGAGEIERSKGLSGKGVIVGPDVQEDFFEGGLLKTIAHLQSKGAEAILILLAEGDLNLLAPYFTYPSYFPPKLGERLKGREGQGYYVSRLIEASKVASRAKAPDVSIHIPIFSVVCDSEDDCSRILDEGGEIPIETSLRFRETYLRDMNIGGIVMGNDSLRRREFLVLGAHYDHLGKDEEKGIYFPGADDNASGVAALLEIVRVLMEKRGEFRRSLLVLFFGGDEWGLKGSRHFVENPLVPLNRIKVMFSLDAIGGLNEDKEVFLVGRSFHPSLAERVRRFLQKLGMKEGQDIDRYSFTFGSDHYPFHQKGIPCLDFFASDYKKLHTAGDHIGRINFDGLAEVARLIYWVVYEYLTEP